jgi:hypothetical protein
VCVLNLSVPQSADIYALGIMMWELYTGEDAFHSLQHPGQFFETVVLQDLRPVIPQGEGSASGLMCLFMLICWQSAGAPTGLSSVALLHHAVVAPVLGRCGSIAV